MAPFLEERISSNGSHTVEPALAKQQPQQQPQQQGQQQASPALHYQPGHVVPDSYDDYQYDGLRAGFPELTFPKLEEQPYVDRGTLGDPQFRNLLASATDIFDYNPKIGTEISGVQLRQLSGAQRDDLARLVATRGVIFFRGQDDFDIDAQLELGQHLGALHKHATSAVPADAAAKKELEDVLVVWKGEGSQDLRATFSPSFLWHSDVSYELQPPSYTSLRLLAGPGRGGGGDTLWSSQYGAYDLLSPAMQRYLESLTALHSSAMQDSGTRALGRPVRRESVVTEHPLVRVNPVTGWKSLYYNPGFVTAIVGVPRLESEVIIRYLNELVATTQEIHCRFQWNKGDVAIWDNRVCNHTATFGFSPHRRHATRVTVHGEKPYYDAAGKSQEEEYNEKYGLAPVSKDGAGLQNYND